MHNYKIKDHTIILQNKPQEYDNSAIVPVETTVLELLKRNTQVVTPFYLGIRDMSNSSLMEQKTAMSTNQEEIKKHKDYINLVKSQLAKDRQANQTNDKNKND